MRSEENIQDKEGLTTQFRVLIADLQHVTFKSCEGLDAEVEVIQFNEGGRLAPPRTARGQQHASQLSFSQGLVSPSNSKNAKKNIFDWFQEVCDPSSPLKKRTISISVEDNQGKQLGAWKALNAWPCKWNGPFLGDASNTLTIEHITFAHEGIIIE